MSKGLKALERIVMPDKLFIEECKRLNIDNHSDYEYLKKELKALEIIKKKEVNVSKLFNSDNVEEYNKDLFLFGGYLTQEEFDLLIEAFRNE